MNLKLRKQKLSITIIGKQRFWIGVSAGIISAISLSIFIDYSREAMRFVSILSGDLMILHENEASFFDYFFATISTVFGLG